MGEIPMSDTTKHAAEVLRSIDKRHSLQHSVRIDHGDADRIEALAAAGLLCTPRERAVIDAAIAETEAEDALSEPRFDCLKAWLAAREARRRAVAIQRRDGRK